MTLNELQRIKQWHTANRDAHPVEYHLWDAVLTVWLIGCVGWLPALAFDELWALPFCLLAGAAPSLYAAWRLKAHRQHRLRCDWLPAA